MPRYSKQQDSRGLTPKEARFVEEYLIDFNARAAATRAGYSSHSAKATGHDLLDRPHVAAALQLAIRRRSERTEITQDLVLQEMARVAFGDIREIFGQNGELLFPAELSEDAAKRISGIEIVLKKNVETQEVERIAKITTSDKMSALNALAKHLGMFQGKGDDKQTVIVFGKDDEAL